MKRCAILLTLIGLTGCVNDAAPLIISVDTLCTSTTRYHATDEQRNQFITNQTLWQPLVDWLAGFNKVRDGECLKPTPGN